MVKYAHILGSAGLDPDRCCFITKSLICLLQLQNSKKPNFVLLSFPEASHSPVKTSSETSPMTSLRQRRDSDRYCQLCNAWFNNPGMAQQHYDGKKHKKNAARADLLEQLGKTLDMGEMKGTTNYAEYEPLSDAHGWLCHHQHVGYMHTKVLPAITSMHDTQWCMKLYM